MEKIGRRTPGLGELLATDPRTLAKRIGGDALRIAMQVKGQAFPMHEPRFKRALGIGYAISPTGADHCHALHDAGLDKAEANGLRAPSTLSSLGVIEPLALESLGPEKVRAALYHTLDQVAMNCAPMCLFVPWTVEEKVAILRAATGWDGGQTDSVGERAFTLAGCSTPARAFPATTSSPGASARRATGRSRTRPGPGSSRKPYTPMG